MKTKNLLFILLGLNCALLIALVYFVKNRQSPAETTTVIPTPTKATPAATARPERETVLAVATNNLVQAFDWRMVESEDYRKYIANLRAIGCPEETIRDIIVADVNKLFDARRKELHTTTNKFEFWKAGNSFAGIMDPDRLERQQALAKEKRALLQELIGYAPDEKPDLLGGFNPFEQMLEFLPSGKQTEVLEVYQKYQAKLLKGLSGGAPDNEDLKKMHNLQREMETELAGILTPQEFEDYQLRMSQTAMMMRMQLASFDPTEQEFREIFKRRKQFDDEFSILGIPNQNAAERDKYNAAKKELGAQLKTLLGDSRFAEYERAQDWNYQTIHRITERQGLPKEAAGKVFDMMKAAEDEARKVRRNKTLSREQRDEALRDIRSETESAIRAVFGDKGFESYQKQPTARWTRNISPDPKPPRPIEPIEEQQRR